MSKRLRYFLVGTGLVVCLAGVVLVLRVTRPSVVTQNADSARTKGPADAPIEIIEYSDFQCPACATAQSTLSELFAAHPSKIRLIYRHFPLQGHRWSPSAHRAAECAARENRFWGYHDLLYRDQAIWSKTAEPPIETFLRYAQEEKLALDPFAQCLSDPAIERTIREESATGSGLGVRSTPSFFVNGALVVGAQGLREKIEKLIRETK